MKTKTRIILLSIIGILIIITIVLGVTYAFMRPVEESSSITSVDIKSCAKITLTDTGQSINLSNTYPMSKNKALQTTPYTFTVSSTCESYVGFNLYLATLNTNTLDAANIHYIITNNGSKEILSEGILGDATNGLSDFNSEEQEQLNNGINGTFSNVYKIYVGNIPYQGEASFDLYLYVDGEVTDASTMGKTFTAGVAVKAIDREKTFAEYIIEDVYTEDGANDLYYHDGVGTYTNADQEAGDNSYRYSGANPNNYVCFGSEETPCPDDNLYRIIGLFDEDQDGIYNIKLIKSTSYGDYAWDSESSNIWSATTKPDIYTTLNTTYWNTLASDWQNKVNRTHKWQVGGMNYSQTNTAKQYYDVEIKNQTGYEETMAVGLMHVSDYGYAASPENWQTALYKYNNTTNTNNNWMYLGAGEWTISHRLGTTNDVFDVYNTGRVFSDFARYARAVRPSVYLKSEIALEGGTGSASDPYRINL